MITYVSKFLPNLSDVTSSMRSLLKKDTEFVWLEKHKQDFIKLKKLLTNTPVLKYYDRNKDVILSVDASSQGLGAVLLQDNLPVAYSSKALTPTQKMWAQIEKELLAIVHGCEKFHSYVYGKHIIVETDHKPLENIFNKSLNDTPLRLQRLRLRLQPYSLSVRYKPGKELLLADALSRNFLQGKYLEDIDQEVVVHTCMLINNLSFSNDKLELFKKETLLDKDLTLIMQYVQHGWSNYDKIPDHLKFYHSIKDDLFVVDGLLFKNSQVVVPKSLRQEMLNLIHYNHFGVDKSKLRAKKVLFWPHMLKEIEDVVKNCRTCLRFPKTHSKEELLLRSIPDGPWQVLGADIFYFKSSPFLLLVDYYSKFMEFKELQKENTDFIIAALKSNFARYGVPKTLYTDQGTQFCNFKFNNFSKLWNFEHITSSPYYARSNGMVERYVQTCKQMLKKAEHSGRDPYIALLEYRNTPIDADVNKSPSELMFGRNINAFLPTPELFKNRSNNVLTDNVRDCLQNRQEKYKYYHDKNNHVKPLSYDKNEIVYVKDPVHDMTTAKIVGEGQRPRSFRIQMPSGKIVDRNRFNIYKASQQEKINLKQPEVESYHSDESVKQKIVPVNEQQNLQQSSADDTDSSAVTRSGRTIKLPRRFEDYYC